MSDPSDLTSKYQISRRGAVANAWIAGGTLIALLVTAALVRPGTTQSAPVMEMAVMSEHSLPLLTAPLSAELPKAEGGSDVDVLLQENTMVAYTGPQGTQADAYEVDSFDQITTYVVREGDTLGHIAELFDISTNTIRWQNDLDHNDVIQPGDQLAILQVDGVEVTVRSGDSLAKIAKDYKGTLDEIQRFNNIYEDSQLKAGMKIMVPGGEPIEAVKPKVIAKKSSTGSAGTSKKTQAPSSSKSGSWIDPLRGAGQLTQSYHGRYRGIDIGAAVGTPIVAAASGKVVIVNASGWGGGYGYYVVIQHDNGAKTLYAHMSRVGTSLGSYVNQGDVIGYVGNTGRSTGPHLHFEIRGWGDVPCVQFGRGVCR